MSGDDSTIRALTEAERVTGTVGPQGATSGTPLIGDVIDRRFRLEGVLGAGGMGTVYEATHLELGERVAIKLVNLEVGASGERLRREARITLRLKSEHVVHAMDVGTLPSGAPYVVMERLVGEDLAALLRREGPLPVGDAVDYVLQACEAMAEAHQQGIVHRDLKPGNLFLTRRADGSPLVKVLDFGIAKTGALTSARGAPLESLTLSTSILGSPQYMAPEQVRGAKGVDHRADVWALGVILHELLAGAAPFSGNGPSAVLAAIAADPPARLRALRPDVPEALEAAVVRCLEKDPERRTPHVAAFVQAIAPFALPRSRVAIERVAGIEAPSAAPTSAGAALPEAVAASTDPTLALSVTAEASPGRRRIRQALAAAAGVAVAAALLRGALVRPVAPPAPSATGSAGGPGVSSVVTGASSARIVPDLLPALAATEAPTTVEPREAAGPPVSPAPAPSGSPARARPARSAAPPPSAAPRRRPPPTPVPAEGADVEAATSERH